MNETNPAQLVPYVTGGAFVLAFIFGGGLLVVGGAILFLRAIFEERRG